MRNALNRLTAVTLMAAVFMVMSFAMISEDTFAASKSPAKPKITKATVVNYNTVNLKWSKAKNAVKYKVYRKKADGKYVLVKTTAKRSYQNKKLAYGTKYTYKVTAVSKAGKKNTSKIKVVFTKPAKPVITAKVQGINGVKVTWKSTKGAIKYKVYRKKAGGKYVLVKTTASTVYLGNGLAYDTKYTYKVKAVSKNNKFTESKVKSITTGTKPAVQTPAVPETPTTPEDPTTPSEPVTPSEPQTPETPQQPAEPSEPAAPETPDCTKVGHNFQLSKVTGATCTENGYNEYKCSRCGETKQEVAFEAMGHNWFVNSKQDSTYMEEGTIWYMCNRCGETKTEAIPKKEKPAAPETPVTPTEPETPTVPTEPVTPSEPQTPVTPEEPTVPSEPSVPSEPEKPDCDEVGHDFSVDAYVDPTEAEDGYIERTCYRCGHYEKEILPKLEQEAPAEPEQPAERTVTVKVPIYETETVYWIREYATGDVVYKTTDPVAFEHEILTRPEPDKWHFGSGAFDNDGDGYPDEKYKIIVGYEEDTFTESEYNYLLENSDIGKMPGIIVIWND